MVCLQNPGKLHKAGIEENMDNTALKENRGDATCKGVGFLLFSIIIVSAQNVGIKWLGGDYPVLEVVVLRSITTVPLALLLYRGEGNRGIPRTKVPGMQLLRGILLFFSYTTFMMGLVALPLAQTESIRFLGPLVITMLSVILLGEKVSLRRWIALLLGLFGVLIVIQPGSGNYNSGSVFILLHILFYGLTIIVTRKMKTTENSASTAFFSSLVYLLGSLIVVPVTLIVGSLPDANRSIAFLFQPWAMPGLQDAAIMCSLGVIWAAWSYSMARAYSLAEASKLAGFEYFSLPISALWGFLLWSEIPSSGTITGSAIILACGLYGMSLDRKSEKSAKIG